MKTVAFHTLGCKVNSYESEAMRKLFEADGYQVVDFKSEADVYVINTCTVTNTGDAKSRQMIRRAHRLNPEACICVVGCYSQVASDEVKNIEGVSVLLGTSHRDQIVSYVHQYEKTKQPVMDVINVMNKKKFEDLKVTSFKENTRAFLKIQDGCNNFCTYCIIPYARGLVCSRPKDSVLEEARQLVAHGFVEIVLTGIHTAGYGMDLENYDFADLLYDLCTQVPGLKRLRISSIETSQINDRILELLKTQPIIVDHLHIPLQAGSDRTLKRMNRKYTTEQYYQKVCEIRQAMPSIALTTDVIVGFPQESDEEFEETYDFIKKVGYSELHVFPYSKRKNTPAANMPGQVDEKVKSERSHRLLSLSKQLHQSYATEWLNHEVEVIFEEISEDGMLVGHASNYLKVKAHGDRSLIGEISKVLLTSYEEPYCFGVIL